MKNILRVIVAIVFSLSGVAGSVSLKIAGVISEPTLVIFVAFSLFLGLVIPIIDRIESLSLRELNLKVTEVKATEASVKQVARAILQVIESQSHGIMLESYDDEKARRAIADLEQLIH